MTPSTSAGAHVRAQCNRTPELRDNSYVMGHHGFVYTSYRVASALTTRHPAVLLLSADYQPFEFALEGGAPLQTNAVVVAPRTTRSLDASGVALLSFNIMPPHGAFHFFRALQRPGVLELNRHAFSHLDEGFSELMSGAARITDAAVTFEQAIAEAVRQMPPASPPDPKAMELIRLVEARPELSLEELARETGRSHQAMSRLFSAAVGMSLRDYQGWLRQRSMFGLLCSKRSLTEVAQTAGFGDSSQFSRTFQRWYGQSPSFSRNPEFVRIRGQHNAAPTEPPDKC
ncbi:MAG: helix-turn-helix transcriptional regulator [Cytophagales bacterium]|nr:helix-turn-helix transcriptional regulator [Rhizobacter sp.]